MVRSKRRSGRGGGPVPMGNRRSERMVELALPTRRRLGAMAAAIAPYARRRPHDPVPSPLLKAARAVLADVRRIMSNEAGGTHDQLGPAPIWAELDATLQLVLADLAASRAAHTPSPQADRVRMLLAQRIEELKRGPEPEGDTTRQ